MRRGEKWSKVGLRGRHTTAPPMFYGKHEHTVDEKNRLTLPAKFRDALSAGVVLARGIDRNIDVYPRKSWEASVERIAELDSLTREAREMKRFVFAAASVAESGASEDGLVPLGENLARQGKTPVFVAVDGEPAGLLAVADPVRSEAREAVAVE